MTASQHPVGSGFGYRSTSTEVLDGIDLTGRLAIVTSGYSGLGLESTRALAGQAKSANSPFAVHLDALGQDAGVRAYAVHPGGIVTPLQRQLSREEMTATGWFDEDGRPDDRFKTPEQGAATTCWAATSLALDGIGGVYCEDCDIAEPTETSPRPELAGVDAHAIDPEAAARLWVGSAELTGIDAFAR